MFTVTQPCSGAGKLLPWKRPSTQPAIAPPVVSFAMLAPQTWPLGPIRTLTVIFPPAPESFWSALL